MKKYFFFISVCLMMVLFLSACFHTVSEPVAEEKGQEQNEAKPHDRAQEKEEVSVQPEVSVNTDILESSRYVAYSKSAFDAASAKKRVYFFHAKWCPSCKTANAEFMSHLDKIPADVVLFKTDYDTETELKEKYDITYQHTFVYVDANGNEIKKWNGGGIDELIANTKS